jgi:hypothetical protein
MLFPHWLMVTGAVLAMLGFVGLAFHRNKHGEPGKVRTPLGTKPKTKNK